MCDDLFWFYDLKNLFNKQSLYKFFPHKQMSYIGKINAISRFIIYLTLILFITTLNFYYLLIGLILLVSIVFFYKKYKPKKTRKVHPYNVFFLSLTLFQVSYQFQN